MNQANPDRPPKTSASMRASFHSSPVVVSAAASASLGLFSRERQRQAVIATALSSVTAAVC